MAAASRGRDGGLEAALSSSLLLLLLLPLRLSDPPRAPARSSPRGEAVVAARYCSRRD
jgi:hypothetical protein